MTAFPLYGVACAACGLPGYRHNPATGLTEHVSGRKPPCRTVLPEPAPRPTVPAVGPALPPRVAQALNLYLQGLTEGQIARRLIVSVPTARTYMQRGREAFKVHSTWEAARIARDRGLLGVAA
jgi:DNA-binding NarL/FixJ family response regulator